MKTSDAAIPQVGHSPRRGRIKKSAGTNRIAHPVHRLRPTPLAMALLLIVFIWITGAIYITTTTTIPSTPSIPGGKMISPPHMPHKKESHLLRGVGTAENTTRHKNNKRAQRSTNNKKHITIAADQVIDMRNLTATLPFEDKDGGAWKQGWDVVPKQGPLTVFVVPHSHCDPGWIKTFDEYFQSQTKSILTTVVHALAKDPKRKFVWAEISYFEWWYREQSDEVKKLTRRLLESKQLEFVTGGWGE